MNKKVSTIFAMAALMGGSLFSSAYATEIKDLVATTAATSLDETSQFAMVQSYGGTEYYYGLKKAADGKLEQMVIPATEDISDEELQNFAWKIDIQDGIGGFTYRFQNVGTGEYLRVISSTDATVAGVSGVSNSVALDPSADEDYIIDQFVFDNYEPYDGTQYLNPYSKNIATASAWTYIQFYDDPSADRLEFPTTTSSSAATIFKKIESKQIHGDALNTLYNSKGFSFAVNVPNNGTVVENIFQDLRAIDVNADVVNAREDGTRWGFPAGTYFVTKDSYDAVKTELGTEYATLTSDVRRLEFLRKLTFIAASSTESVELSGIDRENGQGFELVTISGNDLYDYIGTDLDKLPQNSQVSVYNACFHVEGLATNSFPYSLKLENFYYIDDADAYAADTDGDYDQTKKEVNIEILRHGSPASYYLTTSAATSNAAPFIFKFDESNVVSGISFLKTTDAPSVYNIRFVSGASDATERGKYLTVGDADGASGFEWLAKGEALADAEALATPAYQFVITSVNGNDVTFTNRETGQEFSAKLFDEGEQNGSTVYSLAATTTSDNKTIEVVNIKSNSYGTEINTAYSLTLNDVEIQLIESEVDQYAGFLTVEENELQTIKYARDANTTSNLWYAAVNADGEMYTGAGNLNAVLSNDLYSAAQWKFEEVDELDLSRDYAYNNNNVVAIKGYGDVLKAKVYKIQYVTDGSETGKYLTANDANGGLYLSTTGNEFIVKTYPDGSVKLIKNNSNVLFDDDANALHSQTKSKGDLILTSNVWKFDENLVYDAVREDNEMLTFLVNESPEISWPAEEGHVSIQAAGSDYLTLDTDNNEAIIVNEANSDPFYLHVTDKDAVVPSFYISKGMGETNTAESERMFLFNPQDSVSYQVNMEYDPKYQMSKDTYKAIFKSGIMDESRDTLALTVKGEVSKLVADKSNNQQNVWAGLNRFKFQIIETEDLDGMYYVRQTKAGAGNDKTYYLANINDNAVLVANDNGTVPRYEFAIEAIEAPTANEAISATDVKVVALDGAVNVKNAAGKNVVVSTILGQIVANEVLTSDNATISVPAGIAIVSVDGEEAVKVSVK